MGWYLLQVLVFDLDGTPDVVVLFVLVALGYGLVVARFDDHFVLLVIVLAVVAVMFGQSGGFNAVVHPVGGSYDPGSLGWYYWQQVPPDACHLRRSPTEEQFVRGLGEPFERQVCRYDLVDVVRRLV